MRLIKTVGAGALVALAFSVVASGSASAVSSPEFGRCKAQAGGKFATSSCTLLAKEVSKEKFEWTNTIEKNKFKAHQQPATLATLETVGGTKITCTSEQNSGAEYTSPKTVGKVLAEFEGCETSKIPCNSTGQMSGHINTFGLKGVLLVEKLFVKEAKVEENKNKLEVQLTPETGEVLAEFACSTIHIEVRGCVAHPISSGKMLLSTTEKFTASKGEQKPDKALGGLVDECALESNAGSGFEEAGQTVTAIVENEEKGEANPTPQGV